MAAGYGLAGKRVELLKDMVGSLSRLAVLSNPGNPPHVPYLRETERAATALGLDLRVFEVRGANDLPGAFAAMADWRADGLVTLTDGLGGCCARPVSGHAAAAPPSTVMDSRRLIRGRTLQKPGP